MQHSRRFARSAALIAMPLAIAAAVTSTTVGAGPASATFPGVNGNIAFTTDRTGNSDVFSIPSTGAATASNLSGTATLDRDPAWSPDGRRVAFTRTVGGNSDIYIRAVGSRLLVRVTTNRGVDASASWSPDGRRLVFVSNRIGSASGSFDLYLVRAAREGRTNRPVRISNTAGDENNPEWSPSGAQLAFDLGGFLFDVYVMRVNGTGRRAITDSAFGLGRSYFNPSWSPDGTQIAFDNGADVFRIAATANGGLDCTGCTNLTASAPDSDESDPSWSPDGTQIAFVTDRDQLPDGSANDEVYVMSATDGTGARNVTQNPATDENPVWGPR